MELVEITVFDARGIRVKVETSAPTLMQAIRNADISINAQCDGNCACATCHVYVDSGWIERLLPPTDIEREMLEIASGVTEASRLSCQIKLNSGLNGLVVTMAPGSEF